MTWKGYDHFRFTNSWIRASNLHQLNLFLFGSGSVSMPKGFETPGLNLAPFDETQGVFWEFYVLG